jgi:5-methylcytosine-specific restriction endonuclease McrA
VKAKRRLLLLTQSERIRRQVLRRRMAAAQNARRRAEKMCAPAVELVTYEQIIGRDGDSCHLCGKWLSVHEMTFDHVLPLSRGGEHTPENIRLAHRSCNSKKGYRLEVSLSEF